MSSPLNLLTRKDTVWRGGILPPAALRSFNELRRALCSEPVVNYPRKNRPYALIVDAASGNDKNEGGLGSVLCQAEMTTVNFTSLLMPADLYLNMKKIILHFF